MKISNTHEKLIFGPIGTIKGIFELGRVQTLQNQQQLGPKTHIFMFLGRLWTSLFGQL